MWTDFCSSNLLTKIKVSVILVCICVLYVSANELKNVSTIRHKRAIKSAALYGGSSRILCDQPAAPKNGGFSCTISSRRMTCTATCARGFRFPDGTDLKKHVCNKHDGTWMPDMRFPDCEPVCEPPCQNKGRCYGNNKCICLQQYRGDKCEYPISNCDGSKLRHDGNWACNHTSLETQCTISCPPGMQFDSPPSSIYTCDLLGNWLPQYIPKCIPMHLIVYPTPQTSTLQHMAEMKVVSRQTSGTCTTWSQLHYRTFDGSMYSMQGKCTYLLTRDCSSDTFSIHVKNDPDCNGALDCQRSVIIYIDNNKYTLQQTIKGASVLWGRNRLKVPTVLNGLVVEEVAHYIKVQSALGFTVHWNGKDFIMVEVSGDLFNKTCGLCGRFDGKDSNDFELPDGSMTTSIATLANTWKMNDIGDTCADVSKLTHTCQYDSLDKQYWSDKAEDMCSRIMSSEYTPCHILLDPKPYFEMCRLDFCACGEMGETCACNSISAYFQEFHRLGGKLQKAWRKPDFCPMLCPGNMVYQECGSSCPRTCKKSVQLCTDEQCVDGCHCPPGTVLQDEQCIEESQCPCHYSGKKYKNGDSIQQDCNACVCEGGFWQCTKEKCEARCSSIGDPHYKTFDGKHYDFMGKCSYYLLYSDDLIIEQENVACSGAISENMGFFQSATSDYPSCTKSITIRYKGTVLQLKQRNEVIIDGIEMHELPILSDEIYVYAMSSLYMKAELDNGIDVTWDGASRVYIDAPTSFAGQTKGLCGTYNHNQKDDFLTNEGDIEQDTNAFANKWKVTDSCKDVSIENKLSDPCEIFSQRREQAQLLCGKLKSEIFSTCHDVIDPEPFYKDCMYDMCYCQTKIENCLCPAISDYASQCAKKNSPVDWRKNMRECGLSCPHGQVYQTCGSSCKRSCMDIAQHTKCTDQCVEGCNCPPGMALNSDGDCIVISECPCTHENKNFLPGHKDVRGNMTCECTNARWECKPATESELLESIRENKSRPKCSAAANMEYTECVSECTTTCKNMHSPTKCDSLICKPGCGCKKGYVLDTKTSHCVKPNQCPCHHGGKSFGEGEMIQEDCNTCVCEGGAWKCEKKECPGICTAWGESHFKSFDDKMFEFHGDCDYVLVKSADDAYEKFLVSTHNVPCGSSDVACTKSLTFTIGDEKVTLVSDKPLPKVIFGKRYFIRQVGLFVFIHADIGITLQWDKGTRIYVRADVRWKNKLEGLCGNFNDDENDDFKASDGGPPIAKSTVFGDSWRLHDYCPISKNVNNTCEMHPQRKTWSLQQCSILKSARFRACHSEVPYEPYLEKCIFDSCGCDIGGDCLCLCTALASYAQECNIHGVAIEWRSQELCPIQCEPGSKYTACMSICPLLTCETQYLYSSAEETCGREACVEGCEPTPCPPDQIYNNDREFKCIPKAECVSQPCRVINGHMYHEGERIKDLAVADTCQTCYCRSGNIECFGTPCDVSTMLPPTTTMSTTQKPTPTPSPEICVDGWTEWMNSFTPTFKNGGDYETFAMLRKRQFSFCSVENMKHMECRTAVTHKHYKETGQNVWCSLPQGLLCENKDQPSIKLCQDYEIRVYCQCAPETTTPITTTSTAAITTTSSPSPSPLPSPLIECKAQGWTEWMNSRKPDDNGDYEIIPDLRKKYSFCSDNEISDIQCRATSRFSGLAELRNVECTKDRGAICKNSKSATCQDYEVRFFCLCNETACDAARGMESGAIQDQQISVSSFRTPATLGHRARYNGKGAWSAGYAQKNQWIEVDLDEIQEITGVVTQGNPNSDEWVTTFKVKHSEDGKQWHTIKSAEDMEKLFTGNNDRNNGVKNTFDVSVMARYIRLEPLDWESWISLRMEILGCNRAYPTTEYPTIPTKIATISTTLTSATTEITSLEPSCTTGWTKWMNTDSPDETHPYEINSNAVGDVEAISRLRYFYSFCTNPITVECRTTNNLQMAHLTGQEVRCDLDFGLQCRNDQQKDNHCLDYEIRFYCQCEEITTPTALPCTENEWTPWMNSNNPMDSSVGDIETYESLRSRYNFCPDDHIKDIECRVAKNEMRFQDAGQYGVVCDVNRGLQCLHSMQTSGLCEDYELRLFCLCDETFTTITTTPSEEILASTVTTSLTTAELPEVVCNGWTQWINMDTPDDDGNDRELLSKIENFKTLCPRLITQQCRDAQTKENYLRIKQNFVQRCTANGIVCEGGQQICRDYEIRAYCLCPTPPPTPLVDCEESTWTEWFDIDFPNNGEGDFEEIDTIRKKYKFCPTEQIMDVECQASISSGGGRRFERLQQGKGISKKGGKGGGIRGGIKSALTERWVTYTESGDVGVKCSKAVGLACYNRMQPQRSKCHNYRIRFYCFCGIVTIKPTTPSSKPATNVDTLVTEQPSIKPITATTPMITIPPDLCGWTPWLNTDKPDNFQYGDGDFETIERLQEKFKLCEKSAIKDIQCRLANSKIPWEVSGQHGVVCDNEQGLRCENKLQNVGCYDYEVRLLCKPVWCEETTYMPTTKEPTTITTTPPCKPGQVWKDCAYQCDNMCQSFLYQSQKSDYCDGNAPTCIAGCIDEECQLPNVWRDKSTCVRPEECTCMLEDGQILTPGEVYAIDECENCQCIANSLHCVIRQECRFTMTAEPSTRTTSSKTGYSIFTPSVAVVDECRTEWINVDSPSINKLGDNEYLEIIRVHHEFCAQPIAIECRVAKTRQIAADAGQSVTCDLKTGLVCWNRNNAETGGCYDYEVRFFCPCYASTPTSLTTIEVTTTGFEECNPGFTEWFSIHTPDNIGEYETIHDVRKAGHRFCANYHITETECRVKGTEIGYNNSKDRNITCNFSEGLVCYNNKQTDGRQCSDYEIRFFCQCDFHLTTPISKPTTPIASQTTTATPPSKCNNGFTEWFSIHNPDSDGEYENVQDVRDAGYHFCANRYITAMECQVKGSAVSHDKSEDQAVICSFLEGLICENQKQLPYRQCSDYEIRFFCDCGFETSSVATISSTVVPKLTTSGEGICDSGFTEWFSTHIPDFIGEYEHIQDIRKAGYKFCPNHHITAMECRIKGSDVPYYASEEQGIICDLTNGLICENIKQPAGMTCSDYEIRFLCDCTIPSPEPTSIAPETSSTTKTMLTTKITKGPTTTQTFILTHPPCSYWSEWINEDKPWFGDGDREYKPKSSFCQDGEIQDIQCVTSFGNIPYNERGGQDLQCTIDNGFTCKNKYQKGKLCDDYKIRFYCGCITTTKHSMTQVITIITVPPPPPTPVDCLTYIYYINNKENPLPDNRLQASSSLNSEMGPQSARLQSPDSAVNFAAWVPAVKDTKQYIQVDLIKTRMVYGIVLQGHPVFHSWVTSYEVLFSKDNTAFSNVITPDGSVQLFKGNYDNIHTVTSHFGSPIEARYIRIIPKSWKNDIALRFDVLGCLQFATTLAPTTPSQVCDEPMGIENGLLSDEQITASSIYDHVHSAHKARLNEKNNWAPKTSDKSQFLEFDFMEPRIITGITTQGRENANQWVTSFTVSYSNDGIKWTTVTDEYDAPKVFVANYDGSSEVKNFFKPEIRTRKLRINPQTWHNWIAMRVEIYGCYVPYPTTISTLTTTQEPTTTTTIPTLTTTEEPTTECDNLVNTVVPNHQIELSSSLAGIRSGAPRLPLNTLEEHDTGGWVAGVSNRRQFLLIDYRTPLELTGIITQGRNKHSEWVTDYKVQYSLDKTNWHNAVDELGNTVFPGNFDRDTEVKHFFTPSIIARYIKIVPTRWHDWISMRLAILGCTLTEETTLFPLTSSSAITEEPCHTYGPWISLHVPRPGSPGDIEPIDEIIAQSKLCKSPIKIQCRETISQKPYNEVDQKVSCDLTQGLACLNDEQKGHSCYNYEVRIACWSCQTSAEPTTLPPLTTLCPEIPDIMRSSCPDTCPQDLVCNGLACIHPLDCPCYKDGKIFKAGDILQTSDCEDCICKLNGYSYCSNKTCPICSYGKEGTVNENCECECKTCPEDERLCPTNQVCIQQHLWCDGAVDCPDDEKNCPTTEPTTPTVPPSTEQFICEMNSNHFKTFDGLGYQYDICEHTILQHKETHFNITVHSNCSESGQCSRYLSVSQDDQQITANKNLQVHFNGMMYTDAQLIRLARKNKELTARIIGESVIINSRKYGYEINWNSEANARIIVNNSLAYDVYGLCGYFDNNLNNDKTTPTGDLAETITEFGDSWSIGSQEKCQPLTCPVEVMAQAIEDCNKLWKDPFDACNDAVDPSHYIQICVSSVCECMINTNLTNKDCQCKAYLPYVEACEMRNIAKIRYWRVKQSCLPNCPPGQVWFDCGSVCERTCDNHLDYNTGNTTCTSEQCVPGCFCPAGMVRKGDHCVLPEKCQDCVCKGYGDPHYFSFDGQYFPFQGNCTYVLAQDKVGPLENHTFRIYATNEDCHEEPMTTCTVAIMILYNDHIAHFKVNESVTFDGVQLYPEDFPFHAYGIHVESIPGPGRSISFSVPDKFLEVRYFELNYGFEIRIPSEIYFNRTEGLCGNCDSCKENEFRCKDGKLTNDTDEFAFSWQAFPPEQFESANEICKIKISPTCEPSLEQEMCDRLLSEEFIPCHTLVDPEDYLTACRFDACHSNNPTASICRSVTEYARKCAEVGICIQNWRTEDFCPYKCPAGMYFDQCGPKCPKSCKDIIPESWVQINTKGKDIVPEMLQQTLQELYDICDSSPVDGCFCTDGYVMHNGECVDPLLCETCDEDGHRIGDSWKPDHCTSCTCTSKLTVKCITEVCPPKPTCAIGETTVEILRDNTTCCNKYECLNKTCPTPNIQLCENGKSAKLVANTKDKCPEYICDCDVGQCPPLQMPQLALGEEAVITDTDCCPQVEVVCNPEKCPKKPVCQENHILKEHPNLNSNCCLSYICEPSPNVCEFTHEYDIIDGQQVRLKPGTFIKRAYKSGDIWMDGFCRKCTCESSYSQSRHRCTIEICPKVEDYQDNQDYVWQTEHQPGICCPKFTRTACVVDGQNYRIGEEWESPTGDKCKRYRCGTMPNGEAIKVESITTCVKECDLGSEYVEPPETSEECCGKCELMACVENDTIHTIGSNWNSTSHKCYIAECTKMDKVIQTVYTKKECPKSSYLQGCKQIIKDPDGCCDYCNDSFVPGNLLRCMPTSVPPRQTIEMFKLVDNNVHCTNKLPVFNMKFCEGQCSSTSVYSPDREDFVTECTCCAPTKTKKVTLRLACTDGKQRPIEYIQPTECDCSMTCLPKTGLKEMEPFGSLNAIYK